MKKSLKQFIQKMIQFSEKYKDRDQRERENVMKKIIVLEIIWNMNVKLENFLIAVLRTQHSEVRTNSEQQCGSIEE